jgi:hypothetical protein
MAFEVSSHALSIYTTRCQASPSLHVTSSLYSLTAYTLTAVSSVSTFRPGESLLSLSDSLDRASTFLALFFNNGQWPLVS